MCPKMRPKDMGQAVIAIFAALTSLAIDTPAKQYVAMTGKMCLTSKVFPNGGIKEKDIAVTIRD